MYPNPFESQGFAGFWLRVENPCDGCDWKEKCSKCPYEPQCGGCSKQFNEEEEERDEEGWLYE